MPTPQTAQLVGKYAVYDGAMGLAPIGPIYADRDRYVHSAQHRGSLRFQWLKDGLIFVGSLELCEPLHAKIVSAREAEKAANKQAEEVCRAAIEDAIRSAEKEGE